MSSPQPGRRRRIAGERRSARPAAEATPRTAGAPTDDTGRTAPAVSERTSGDVTVAVDTAAQAKRRPRRTPRRKAPRTAADRSAGWWGSSRSLGVLAGVLSVLLLVGALLAFGLLGNDSIEDVRREEAVERASRSATATAERAAAAVLAYDHQSLESGKENAVRFLTDDFAKDYSETFDKVVAPSARETRATVTAEVQASAVVRGSEDQVRVLLFIDQTTKSTANPTPQLALNRVEMVMVPAGDSWKVDEITSY